MSMLCRRLQDLTYCISYNINFFNDKAHGGKQFRNKYTMLEELGRGGFGIVYKAERNEDNAPVAVKFVEHRRVREWTMKCKQLIPTEICLLDMCRSIPGVVGLIDWFANSKGFLIVMERPRQCLDLFDLISIYGYLDEDIARSIFLQLLNTTYLLYSTYGIFHRDIKDENVIINMHTGEAILVDFGAAALISEACIKDFQGTRLYCPPEWFKRLTYKPLEATVWSLGIILYVMVSGYLPFQNEIQICLGRFTTPKHISKECENLLRQCLAVTPCRRPNLSEIFKHCWLNQPIVTHAESFKIVLQRHLQRKRKAQSASKLQKSSEIEESGRSANKSGKMNEFATMRSIPTNDDTLDSSPYSTHHTSLQSHDNSAFNFEFVKKNRHHSSYDNVVMNTRMDKEYYQTDNNILIRPSSIAEESECSSGSPFSSDFESFSMISSDPQNSESYVTALEDQRECSSLQRLDDVAPTLFETFSTDSPTQTLSFFDNSDSKRGDEEMIEQNRPMEYMELEKVMNSKLVAKHWPQNGAEGLTYDSFKLQRPSSIYCEKNQPQREATTNSILLQTLSDESGRSSTLTITAIISK